MTPNAEAKDFEERKANTEIVAAMLRGAPVNGRVICQVATSAFAAGLKKGVQIGIRAAKEEWEQV